MCSSSPKFPSVKGRFHCIRLRNEPILTRDCSAQPRPHQFVIFANSPFVSDYLHLPHLSGTSPTTMFHVCVHGTDIIQQQQLSRTPPHWNGPSLVDRGMRRGFPPTITDNDTALPHKYRLLVSRGLRRALFSITQLGWRRDYCGKLLQGKLVGFKLLLCLNCDRFLPWIEHKLATAFSCCST